MIADMITMTDLEMEKVVSIIKVVPFKLYAFSFSGHAALWVET